MNIQAEKEESKRRIKEEGNLEVIPVRTSAEQQKDREKRAERVRCSVFGHWFSQ
jgi:hypothetical protein